MRAILISVGSVFVLDTVVILFFSNPNMGVFLPAILGTPLLTVGLLWNVLAPLWHTPFGAALRIVLIAGYCAAFLFFTITTAIIVGGQKEPDALETEQTDAVIVLGAGLRDGKPSLTLRGRLNVAAAYYKEHPDCVIVTTGGVGYQQTISEAEAMALYLMEKGVPSEAILQESTSTSTQENLSNADALLRKNIPTGQYKALVVTSDFHVFRAVKVARKMGIDAWGRGSTSAWYMRPNHYLRECCTVLLYALRGSI